MLDPFAQLFQHCWGHARSLCMDYKDLWVVFFPRCTAGPKLVGSCCIRLHTTANTHVTTPNIVGTTILGVVAPVYTQPNTQETMRTTNNIRSNKPKKIRTLQVQHTFLYICRCFARFMEEVLLGFTLDDKFVSSKHLI